MRAGVELGSCEHGERIYSLGASAPRARVRRNCPVE
jgi:hypothetical protein